MIASTASASTTSMTRAAEPRLIEVVVGRLLELVVHSVEGARERLRSRLAVH